MSLVFIFLSACSAMLLGTQASPVEFNLNNITSTTLDDNIVQIQIIIQIINTHTAPPSHQVEAFEKFIQDYNKKYENAAEKETRFKIFRNNMERAKILNKDSKDPVFGITQFMDLTPEEFTSTYANCFEISPGFNFTDRFGCTDISDDQVPNANAPESLDWRQSNYVTRVKDQQDCGGCYAFSATGNIEGQYAKVHQQLIELSEQQIVDCDTGSTKCHGGYMPSSFRSLADMGGIETVSDYPYINGEQACKFDANKVAVKLKGCYTYNIASQEKLKQLLYQVGPISIGVQASNFQMYHGGVFSDQDCNVGNVNHAVLLVGYGTENGKPYWLIKNSWNESFGERGYIKIQRGENALSCGMMRNGLMSSSVIQ